MEFSRGNGSNPFSSLKSELNRLKGALQRINQSITEEAEGSAADAALTAEAIEQGSGPEARSGEKTKTPVAKNGAGTASRPEESSNEKILELEKQLKIKEWLLKTRDTQIKKLRAELVEAKISLMTESKEKWDSQGWRKRWKQAVRS